MAKGLDRNLKVAGSSPSSGTLNFSLLVRPPSAPTELSKGLGVCKYVYGFAHLKEHLELFENRWGLSSSPGFLSIIISSSSRHRRELTMAVLLTALKTINNQSTTNQPSS